MREPPVRTLKRPGISSEISRVGFLKSADGIFPLDNSCKVLNFKELERFAETFTFAPNIP